MQFWNSIPDLQGYAILESNSEFAQSINQSNQFMKRSLALTLLLILPVFAWAQEEKEGLEHEPKVRGAVMMANSHVPLAKNEGGKSIAIIPTWAFDFDYYFQRRWSAALQVDIKLQSFQVEHEQALLERSYPLSVTLVGHYHALRHWSFFAGPGYEFEKNENLFLIKIGTEYSFEISEEFEIALNFIYEGREEVYDGYTFGVAFNKVLWRKRE